MSEEQRAQRFSTIKTYELSTNIIPREILAVARGLALRALLAIFSILALYPFPTALADAEPNQTTTAVSGHYLDPITNLVYYYDADANTLTLDPAATAGTAIYAYVDVYRRGDVSETSSGSLRQCQSDYCVSWLLAYVGNHPAQLWVKDWPFSTACGSFESIESRSPTLGLVTFWQGSWDINHCESGVACAELRTDFVPRWRDCAAY